MHNAKYKFIYLDQNIYGFLSPLDTPKKRDYFFKAVAFAHLIHSGNEMKFVYNLTTIHETSQITGARRNIFLKQHLNCIKSITHGNLLIRTGKNYELCKGRDPFVLMDSWNQQRKDIVEEVKSLPKSELAEDQLFLCQELIHYQGQYTKVLTDSLNKKTNFLTQQTRAYAKQLNNLTAQNALNFLENEIKENTPFASLDELLETFGAKDFNSKNMAKNLILEFAGYRSLPLSKLSKKLPSALHDSSIFAYVIDVIDIFVSNDNRLLNKLRDFCGSNYLFLNLDEFISYIEQINIKIDGKINLKFIDFYDQYIKPTLPAVP